ncbi:MAG: carboxynorspermidine decarboxylase [Myxococcales bacterium]|nr:carboxynorspermidine decarboxylase [Myxococcales bacterium]
MAARINVSALQTPCYVTDLGALAQNLALMERIQREADCKIILALKGFAQWSTFPLIKQYLQGTTASSVAEARLGREEFGGEVHAYAPAWSEADLREIVELVDHIVFNSPGQWKRLRPIVAAARARGRKLTCGLRTNPEHREVEVALYDPAAACSRLGTTRANVTAADLEGLDGLHFHTLCELGSDALERTLEAFVAKFGEFLPQCKWVNFGGGHHITRPGYDVERLIAIIKNFKARFGVDVYLEPGEAVALGTGVLVASVLDIFHNGVDIAILDTSATAHMPDVLEMPYRPQILGAGEAGATPHTYRLGGLTCLAGDVIGDYSFAKPLAIGDKLVFLDMAHYTMVKNTMFNGVQLPSIATHDPATGHIAVSRSFGYEDYRNRLA